MKAKHKKSNKGHNKKGQQFKSNKGNNKEQVNSSTESVEVDQMFEKERKNEQERTSNVKDSDKNNPNNNNINNHNNDQPKIENGKLEEEIKGQPSEPEFFSGELPKMNGFWICFYDSSPRKVPDPSPQKSVSANHDSKAIVEGHARGFFFISHYKGREIISCIHKNDKRFTYMQPLLEKVIINKLQAGGDVVLREPLSLQALKNTLEKTSLEFASNEEFFLYKANGKPTGIHYHFAGYVSYVMNRGESCSLSKNTVEVIVLKVENIESTIYELHVVRLLKNSMPKTMPPKSIDNNKKNASVEDDSDPDENRELLSSGQPQMTGILVGFFDPESGDKGDCRFLFVSKNHTTSALSKHDNRLREQRKAMTNLFLFRHKYDVLYASTVGKDEKTKYSVQEQLDELEKEIKEIKQSDAIVECKHITHNNFQDLGIVLLDEKSGKIDGKNNEWRHLNTMHEVIFNYSKSKSLRYAYLLNQSMEQTLYEQAFAVLCSETNLSIFNLKQ